jgi:signal transduction histidine kinase/PAS domain-containing protein
VTGEMGGAGEEQRAGQAERTLLRELGAGAPLQVMLEHLVRELERRAPGLMASVMLVVNGRLLYGAAPSLPAGFNAASDNHPIGEGYGSCGAAAHRGELVVVEDVQRDSLWTNYRDIARRYELAACWSMPVRDRGGAVLGTFALYHPRPRLPRREEIDLLREYAGWAAVAIEHHRTGALLRAREREIADLVEDLEAIRWQGQADARQAVQVSAGAARNLGHPPERLRDDPALWSTLIHPDDRPATLRRQQEVLRCGGADQAEYRLLSAGGGISWVRDLLHARTDPRTGEHHLEGTVVDISRQREAEQEREDLFRRMADEQNLLRAVVRRLPGAVVITGGDGRILVTNEEADRLLGTTLVRGSLQEGGDGDPWSIWRALRAGEAVEGREIPSTRADGTRGTLRATVAPVRNAEGRLLAAVATFCDVSESKDAESTLRLLADAGPVLGSALEPEATARAVAQLAVRALADWCLVFTTTDEGGLRCAALEQRSPGTQGDLAAAFDRLLSQPGGVPFRVAAVIASGAPQLFSPITAEAFEPGAVRPEIMRLVRGLGAESAMAVPLAGQNRTLGAIVYGAASAERRYGARDLQVAQELARRAALALETARLHHEAQVAIRQREEFLSVAAHELNTPLASLQLTMQTIVLALEQTPVDLPFLRGRAAAGERHSQRLGRLVGDLLDVSRVRAGQMHLARQQVDLVACVQAVLARLQVDVASAGIDVTLHAPAPVTGMWDQSRLEQVVTNLMTNAIKYGERRPVRVSVQSQQAVACLQVQDHGIGMTPELVARLFTPFERGVPAGQYGGLGLGLYITAQIVRAHAGTISVRSRPGEGATFTVELPRHPGAG